MTTESATQRILERGIARRMNFRRIDERTLGLSLDETSTRADVEAIWAAFAGADAVGAQDEWFADTVECLPPGMRRSSAFLKKP